MPKLSWTAYKVLKDCGHQYKLKYRDKIRMPQDQRVYLVGRVIHDIIKLWVRSGYDDRTVTGALMKSELLKAIRSQQGHVTPEAARDMAKKIATGVPSAMRIYKRLKFKEHGAIVEQWFNTSMAPGASTMGAADVYDPVTKTLYDLKNYTSTSSKADIEQLLHYSMIFRKMGHPVDRVGFIYPFLTVEVVHHAITQEDLDLQIERFLRACKRAEEEAFGPPIEGSHCYFCDFHRTQWCPVTAPAKGRREGTEIAFVHSKDGQVH